jgi:glycosyltransferase involved in cell wall biosynthesis
MKQVLWLTSWYPNKFDAYNGDFIQRHAQAVAPYCKLNVIHVQLVPSTFQVEKVTTEQLKQTHFQEQILYVRQSNLPFPFNKIIDQINYERYFKKAIKQYLFVFGKPDIVHVHVPVKAGKLALWLKQKFGIPYLLTEHYGIYNDYAEDKFVNRSWWFKRLTKKVIQQATTFLPVSNSLGKAVNKLVVKKSFQVVFNVVDTNIFKFIPAASNDEFWFIHVSTMNHPKNADGILRAFAKAYIQNTNLRLRMVGPASEDLRQQAIILKIEDVVIFTGMLTQQKVASLMQQSNAFVLFSNYENMPCVIAEALCCGLPIISTNVGGIAEVINANNGILVNPKDENALVEAMLTVVHQETAYLKDVISENAKHIFAYEIIGKRIASFYSV